MTVRLFRLKPARDPLRQRGPGQQVAGDLLDREPVERLVGVERGDHPVAPRPHGTGEVVLKTVGVGVAGAVEPVHGHAFAVRRRCQQSFDQPLVGAGRAVGQEGVGLARRGREARQIEVDAADQRLLGGGRRVRQLLGLQPTENEGIDRVPHPVALLDRRRSPAPRRLEGPVLAPGCTLVDPLFQQFNLLGLQGLARLAGRHHLVGIGAGDPAIQLTLAALARHDDRLVLPEGASLTSSRRSALRVLESGPWQRKQWSDRIGRISLRKSTGAGSAAWAVTGMTPQASSRSASRRRARRCGHSNHHGRSGSTVSVACVVRTRKNRGGIGRAGCLPHSLCRRDYPPSKGATAHGCSRVPTAGPPGDRAPA